MGIFGGALCCLLQADYEFIQFPNSIKNLSFFALILHTAVHSFYLCLAPLSLKKAAKQELDL